MFAPWYMPCRRNVVSMEYRSGAGSTTRGAGDSHTTGSRDTAGAGACNAAGTVFLFCAHHNAITLCRHPTTTRRLFHANTHRRHLNGTRWRQRRDAEPYNLQICHLHAQSRSPCRGACMVLAALWGPRSSCRRAPSTSCACVDRRTAQLQAVVARCRSSHRTCAAALVRQLDAASSPPGSRSCPSHRLLGGAIRYAKIRGLGSLPGSIMNEP